MKKKKTGEKPAKKSGKTLGKTSGMWGNFVFWTKRIWDKSPLFVCLYAAEIPVWVGIYLLDAYLPSVLVEDVTAGKSVGAVAGRLLIVGGMLAAFHVAQDWLQKTEELRSSRIRRANAEELIGAAMDAEYKKIETPDFQNEFMKLQQMHLWSGTYTDDFLRMAGRVVMALISLVLFSGMLSGLSPWIMVLIVLSALFAYAVGVYGKRWESRHWHTWWELDLKMEYLGRNLSSYEAAKDVHLYNMAPWLKKRYDKELKQRLRYTVRMQANYYMMGAAHAGAFALCQGVSWLYLVFCVTEGRIDAAQFVLYAGITVRFMDMVNCVIYNLRNFHEKALYVEEQRKLEALLEKEDESGKEELTLAAKEGQASVLPVIEFRNVGFCYEGSDAPVLQGINLTLHPGENLALVGLNGAGKTTFIKLLCGFYDPTEGEILINGTDRRRYTRASWFRCFSGVFQETGFFPMSLRENIAPGEKIDEARLQECLRIAGMEEKLASLPAGEDTLFGAGILNGAADFSGGEIQKLMLARALYKRAAILVLDEPTAALDPIAESGMYEKYHELSAGKTTVFISHRLASTRFCDRILLLEEGRITEEGTHGELLKRNGKYAQMYRVQSKYYEQAEAGLEGEVVL